VAAFFSKLLTRMQAPEPDVDPESEQFDRDVFAHQVRTLLATTGLPARYDADAFALRLGAGATSWLGNRFDEYARAPADERDEVVLHAVRGIVEASRAEPLADDLDDVGPYLRPRIRQRAHLVIQKLQLEADGVGAAGRMPVLVPLTADLGAEVVYDTPTSIVTVPAEQVGVWGLTPRKALRMAIDNLLDSAPDPFTETASGVWRASVGDCYDSARLLLTKLVAGLPLLGEPVALPANRDTLVITGTEHLTGLYHLLEAALEVMERPRVDTLQPVVLRAGRWRDWLPGPEHPMHEAFYELATRTRGTSYAEVQSLVEANLARTGDERMVASYGLLRLGDGSTPWSHAVWGPVRGWLPESDLVSVLSPDAERYVVVPRAQLVKFAGHLLERVPELHPPYLAFEGAPDRVLYERLRAYAVLEGTTRD
jgi:hypothetical protein